MSILHKANINYTAGIINFSEFKRQLVLYYLYESNFKYFTTQHHGFKSDLYCAMDQLYNLSRTDKIYLNTNGLPTIYKASTYYEYFPPRIYGRFRLAINLNYKDYSYRNVLILCPSLSNKEFQTYKNSVSYNYRRLRLNTSV